MCSKYTYLFDPGHGGLVNGKYVTPGKRSPKFDDGSVLYEGVNNRDNVNIILKLLKEHGIDCIDIVDSSSDISLHERVSRANKLSKKKKCIYISIHSDGAGDGLNWHSASGMSVYTSKGQTKSDILADIMIESLQEQFGDTIKWRTDTYTDGDLDKEENFYVLKNTVCPAILCELGFHTNKDEALRMLTKDFKEKIAKSVLNTVLEFEKL